MKPPKRFASASFFLILFIAIIIAFAVLKVASSVLIPIAMAVLLSFVFEPIITFLNEKIKLPKILSIILVMLILTAVIFFAGTLLLTSLRTILSQYPKYEQRFMIIYEYIADLFNLPFDSERSLFKNLWETAGIRAFVQNSALSFSNSLIDFLKDMTMVFLFIFFFLSEMRFFRDKVEIAFADIFPSKIRKVFTDIVNQITRYISVKFFVSLLTGILVFAGTLLFKLDFPIIWGFLAFIMNFIPNFGSIISTVLTSLFALIQFWPDATPFFLTFILMLFLNMFLGNLVEPKIQGRNLGLSPFVIIASLSIWGWIWGFSGLVLGVPLMVVLKIICENVEILYPVSVLLGSMPKDKNTDRTEQEPIEENNATIMREAESEIQQN